MKRLKYVIVLLCMVCLPVFVFGQHEVDTALVKDDNTVIDTLSEEMLPVLSKVFYEGNMNVNRSYDYQLLNKKKLYTWVATEVLILGLILSMDVFFCTLYNVPLWIALTSWGVVFCAALPPSIVLMKKYNKMANAVDVSKLAQFSVRKNVSVDIVHYNPCMFSLRSVNLFGLGVTLRF